jgi:glycine amidinotransferase
MIKATMPARFHEAFKPNNPFPPQIIRDAEEELENFASLLRSQGIHVLRSAKVDWLQTGGYTGAMPRDGLLVVGNTIIESCFAWKCRANEVADSLGALLSKLEVNPCVKVVRAPRPPAADTLYNGIIENRKNHEWAINNSRPVFDAADFMRFGSTVIGQLSNVTNMKGVEYIQHHVPAGYKIELLDVNDPHAMHIDATLLPLRNGLMVYNPLRVTEESLRDHAVFENWELAAYPFVESVQAAEQAISGLPRFMTSAWLVMNALVLGDDKIVVEEQDHDFVQWLEGRGMEVLKAPFRNVHAIGGSFHCASVDLERS